MMRIDVLTIFPELFSSFLGHGMMKRAQERGLIRVHIHDLRDYTFDRHRSVDDVPYGGGAGMVMKVEPIHRAVSSICPKEGIYKRILLSPQGKALNQEIAKRLATEQAVLLICGRYEGVDERVREYLVDEEISIGDYILTGGEIPAMVLMEVIIRFVPGVLGSQDSLTEESFSQNWLEYPQYTRPAEYQGWQVPEVLLSGHHKNIKKWRFRQSLFRTAKYRPDLIEWANVSNEDREWLDQNGVTLPDTLSEEKRGGAGD